jgi:Xaa-Pro aminopeptidase
MGAGEAQVGFVGHGVGLELDELPVLADMDMPIEEGNVIAVEPKMMFPSKGVVGIEDTFVVKEDDVERATKCAQEIWIV